ncbi:MAG: hypothetical protein H7834_14870 [Magnetococcus sp. YQC-9]
MRWIFEIDAEGRNVIRHQAAHRFSAYWVSGRSESFSSQPGACWTQPGSDDGEDSQHLFGLLWVDPQPDSVAFNRLMQEASTAIDDWIASRL